MEVICKICKKRGFKSYYEGHSTEAHEQLMKKRKSRLVSEETKKKISDTQKGVPKNPESIRKMIESNTGSDRPSTRGEKHWNWKGGVKRNGFLFQKNRRKVLKRDNYTCIKCGITESELGNRSKLHIHHIDHNHKNDDILNLVTLCYYCNPSAEAISHRDWEFILKEYTMFRSVEEKEKTEILLNV